MWLYSFLWRQFSFKQMNSLLLPLQISRRNKSINSCEANFEEKPLTNIKNLKRFASHFSTNFDSTDKNALIYCCRLWTCSCCFCISCCACSCWWCICCCGRFVKSWCDFDRFSVCFSLNSVSHSFCDLISFRFHTKSLLVEWDLFSKLLALLAGFL